METRVQTHVVQILADLDPVVSGLTEVIQG